MNRLDEFATAWAHHPHVVKQANWIPKFPVWPTQFLKRISKTLSADWLRVSHRGRFLNHMELQDHEHSIGRDGIRRVSAERLDHFLCDGATVVFRSVDSYHEPCFQLVETLSARFNCRVACNFYAAKSMSKGFGAHFDSHHIFVVQAFGQKTWQVEARPNTLVKTSGDVKNQISPLPENSSVSTFHLTAGDVLYVPKGARHSANAEADGSCHFSFGIHIPTGIDAYDKSRADFENSIEGLAETVNFYGDSLKANQMARALHRT